jgi:hypothetical protein
VYRGHVERFVTRERRKERWHPTRESRLPRARRTDEQDAMPSRSRNLQGTPCAAHATDVAHIRSRLADLGWKLRRLACAIERSAFTQMADDVAEARCDKHLNAGEKRGFVGIVARDDGFGDAVLDGTAEARKHATHGSEVTN